MKKFTILTLMAAIGVAASAQAQTYMEKATLDYPAGLFSSFPPASVSVTYNNQPLELIDPHYNDFDEECVTAYVQLGEGEQLPVSASILYSFGNPEDPEDEDIWNLDIALYELDDLWSFDGNMITVYIPEGIVKNAEGAVNPAQDFVFEIMPTYTDYLISPAPGEELDSDLTVTVSFGGNTIEYLQSEVRAMTYEPQYKDIALEFGKDVTINGDNELIINLSCLESGDYEIVVPEGYVFVIENGEKYLSPDIWLEYTVENNGNSGVTTVVDASQSESVYSLQGIRLKQRPEKGIFIVNGKKVAK